VAVKAEPGGVARSAPTLSGAGAHPIALNRGTSRHQRRWLSMHRARQISDEDIELDKRWRARFGEPLPILGAGRIVREVLARPIAPPVASHHEEAGPTVLNSPLPLRGGSTA